MHRKVPLATFAAVIAALALFAPSAAAIDCAPHGKRAGGPVDQAAAASLLFLPGPVRTPEPELTAQIERLPGFAAGLFSPTLGRYSPTQMMLDISQGSRVAGSLYSPVVAPPPGLLADGFGPRARSGRFMQWPGLVRRAERVPGEIVPGLLACSVAAAGLRSLWVTSEGSPTSSGIAAADAHGRIAQLRFVPPGRLRGELFAAQRSSELLIAALPASSNGLALVRALAAADPERLIVLVQAPPDPARTRLLSLGVRGVGGDGIRSATTRRDGLVVATDVAPTLLDRLRITQPSAMQGQPIEAGRPLNAAQLGELNARLALVAGRRGPVVVGVFLLGVVVILLLLLLGRFTGRRQETARLVARLVGLAVLWLPLFLLVTAILRPSRSNEIDIVLAGSLLAALATDRLVPWPRAPWVPALAVTLAHGIDFLAFSGRFTGESLLGSNPLYGARFYGVGNELETVIVVSCVIGVGAALCGRPQLRPARWFAAAGVLVALFLGAGRLGADVGGVIFAGAAFGAAAVYVARLRLTPLRVAGVIVLLLAGLAAIALLDALTGGQSHLTRTVVDAQSAGDLLNVAQRRFAASINGARAGGVWLVVILAVALLIVGWRRRERLLAPLGDALTNRPYRAGLAGALVGTVIGALANDSGPAILIIGTVYLAIGLSYARGRPLERVDDS
jgi:hypothetical protein